MKKLKFKVWVFLIFYLTTIFLNICKPINLLTPGVGPYCLEKKSKNIFFGHEEAIYFAINSSIDLVFVMFYYFSYIMRLYLYVSLIIKHSCRFHSVPLWFLKYVINNFVVLRLQPSFFYTETKRLFQRSNVVFIDYMLFHMFLFGSQ